MQNQPNAYAIINTPIKLPEDFPVYEKILNTHSPSHNPPTRLHTHNCLEIGCCTDGGGIFIVDSDIYPFSKGDVSIIFGGQLHIAQSHKQNISSWQFIHLNPEYLLKDIGIDDLKLIADIQNNPGCFKNIFSPKDNAEITKIVNMIIFELINKEQNYRSCVKSLVWLLLVKLYRTAPDSSINDTDKKTNSSNLVRIAPALNYISNNYKEPIKISDLARLCNMSITNFRRLFTSAINLSPLEYLIRVRIKTASVLLHTTNYPILNISLMVGFETQSSFNRHFKRIMAQTPFEYRVKRQSN